MIIEILPYSSAAFLLVGDTKTARRWLDVLVKWIHIYMCISTGNHVYMIRELFDNPLYFCAYFVINHGSQIHHSEIAQLQLTIL